MAIIEKGKITQTGSIEDIILNPANQRIDTLFKNADLSKVITVGEIAGHGQLSLIKKSSLGFGVVLQRLKFYDRNVAYYLDHKKHFLGVLTLEKLEENIDSQDIEKALETNVLIIQHDMKLNEIYELVANYAHPLPVLNEDNVFLGTISKTLLLQNLNQMTPCVY